MRSSWAYLAIAGGAAVVICCGGRATKPHTPDGAAGAGPAADACQEALGVSCDEFEEAYVKASNTAAGDELGYAVSLSGDSLAVGALAEASCGTGVDADQSDDACSGAGAAYVFRRDSAGNWQQEAYIKPSHVAAEDRFGRALSLDGDTLAVAARQEDHCAEVPEGSVFQRCEDAGAVFVFRRSELNGKVRWQQEAYLKASNVEPGDQFGWAVTLAGDTLAASSIFEQSCATGVDGDQNSNDCHKAGAVYVFRREGTQASPVWMQEAYLKAESTDPLDEYGYFGRALSLYGDALAVGADGDDTCSGHSDDTDPARPCAGSGAAYVFRRSESSGRPLWAQEAFLKASESGADAAFGSSVSLFEDTLAVGAPGEASCAKGVDASPEGPDCPEAGAAYVFERSVAGDAVDWQQAAYLKATNTDAHSNSFGDSVSLWASRLAVGAPGEDSCATGVDGDADNDACEGAGAVFLFDASPAGEWSERAYLKASHKDGEPPTGFGHAVSLFESTLAIGAPLEDGCSTQVNGEESHVTCQLAGAVYLRRIAP